MELFEVRNGKAFPSVHALIIEPFKSMWANDRSDGKGNCINDFTYIELLCSPKKSNPFFGYPPDTRVIKVKDEVYKDPEHELSYDVVMATLKYRELLTADAPGYDLLCTGINTVDKLKEFLDGFDPNTRTNSGGLLLKPADITKAIGEIPNVIKTLTLAREKVHSELEQDTKNRNNREIGEFEN